MVAIIIKKALCNGEIFFEEVLHIIEESSPCDNDGIWKAGFQLLDAVKCGFISPKLYDLLQIFQSFGESSQVHCLVFVERKITAKVISRLMSKIDFLSPLSFSYLTGASSSIDALKPKMQRSTLDSFHCGKLNILFTTDVAEEGIDVHNCSYVIRFDLPKTVRSYIQSRGRGRKNNSQYILMLERGNVAQRNQLFDIIRSELSMTDLALNRDPSVIISKMPFEEDSDAYVVQSTGATATLNSSISLVKKYCERLPGDKHFIPRPYFQLALHGGSFECTLTLPPNAAFQSISGPICRNSQLAKQYVCLDACKKLHQMGVLDDHLLPLEETTGNDFVQGTKVSTSDAGTTKRKEMHGTTSIDALSGNWAHRNDSVTLWAYRMNFNCSIASTIYSGFVLLLEAELDDDVANTEVKLYLVDKVVESTISTYGQVNLSCDQVRIAKAFQELFFNSLFGKLFTGSRSSKSKRKFLLQEEKSSLWSTSNMYLLLPLESRKSSNCETFNIDWKGIASCASVVDFFKNQSFPSADCCFTGNMGLLSSDGINSSKTVCNGLDNIYLANSSVHLENLKNMVVVAIHTGKMYSVLDLVVQKSAESPFDGGCDTAPSIYTSFSDYFNKKYGIVLKHPRQPLLLLKQSHNAHNLLSSKFTLEVNVNKGKKVADASAHKLGQKPQAHVHMPPELLISINLSYCVLRSFYLLPSLMHRLESLLLASQLRKEIAGDSNNCNISSLLIVEALTTLRCCEDFSLERLELLGDSVLKYVISCHLFLKYPQNHEGQLTAHRSWIICNRNLHKLGTGCKLQGYIRDNAFDPRRWTAPGQLSIHPVPCKCGLDDLYVPMLSKYVSEDTSIVLGKSCDRGHRWMCSKTIADCVEALIGAYYVGGGINAAIHMIKWLHIDAELDLQLVEKAIQTASLYCYAPKINEIEALEMKVKYEFSVKGLLLEAMTHASLQEFGAAYCYQRLEFLGDSVLDILITRHLFQRHTDIDPGELTDLRAANVNNENFAQVAVRNNLQKHLQHASECLLGQITDYVTFLSEFNDNQDYLLSYGGSKVPKVLGDLVESIAGAILIDTKLNLDKVWEIYETLLAPIVTPDKLELAPLRQLIELCDRLGYCIRRDCTRNGETVVAKLSVQMNDVLLVREGCDKSQKFAKADAALQLLNDLKERGFSHPHNVSKRKECDQNSVGGSSLSHINAGMNISNSIEERGCIQPHPFKRQRISENLFHVVPSAFPFTEEHNHSEEYSKASSDTMVLPVTISINMEKGGPRTSLYELCRRFQWPLPTFISTEQKSRSALTIGERKKVFNSFVSKMSLCIPNDAVIELEGEVRADKKSSQDSAALVMLYELEKRGRCVIKS